MKITQNQFKQLVKEITKQIMLEATEPETDTKKKYADLDKKINARAEKIDNKKDAAESEKYLQQSGWVEFKRAMEADPDPKYRNAMNAIAAKYDLPAPFPAEKEFDITPIPPSTEPDDTSLDYYADLKKSDDANKLQESKKKKK